LNAQSISDFDSLRRRSFLPAVRWRGASGTSEKPKVAETRWRPRQRTSPEVLEAISSRPSRQGSKSYTIYELAFCHPQRETSYDPWAESETSQGPASNPTVGPKRSHPEPETNDPEYQLFSPRSAADLYLIRGGRGAILQNPPAKGLMALTSYDHLWAARFTLTDVKHPKAPNPTGMGDSIGKVGGRYIRRDLRSDSMIRTWLDKRGAIRTAKALAVGTHSGGGRP